MRSKSLPQGAISEVSTEVSWSIEVSLKALFLEGVRAACSFPTHPDTTDWEKPHSSSTIDVRKNSNNHVLAFALVAMVSVSW